MTNDREKWDARYAAPGMLHGAAPAAFLRDNAGLLPRCGLALDVAAGEGQNAVFLAELGLEVMALDISASGLRKCRRLARERGVTVAAAVVDLTRWEADADRFDLIVVFNYLQRDLLPKLIAGLKPGGVLVCETMTTEHLRWKPDFNPDFLLRPGELARLCAGLRLLKYREADIAAGLGRRAVASIIADKAPCGEGDYGMERG